MKTKILIIEDDLDLSKNLRTLLEEEKFEVLDSITGDDGIEKAKKLKPDLILCDIMMSGKSGFEVKKELNDNYDTFDIPLIFLTAKTEFSSLREGMKLGAEDYLFKPYKAEELLEVINFRIEKQRKMIAKSAEKYASQADDSILINIGKESKIIKYSSIKAVFASNQYSNILLTNGKMILVRKSLNDWENTLPQNRFVRIHRSSIVNFEFIDRIERTNENHLIVYLIGYDGPLDVSRRYASNLRNKGS